MSKWMLPDFTHERIFIFFQRRALRTDEDPFSFSCSDGIFDRIYLLEDGGEIDWWVWDRACYFPEAYL